LTSLKKSYEVDDFFFAFGSKFLAIACRWSSLETLILLGDTWNHALNASRGFGSAPILSDYAPFFGLASRRCLDFGPLFLRPSAMARKKAMRVQWYRHSVNIGFSRDSIGPEHLTLCADIKACTSRKGFSALLLGGSNLHCYETCPKSDAQF
jgi:hypothetical protein